MTGCLTHYWTAPDLFAMLTVCLMLKRCSVTFWPSLSPLICQRHTLQWRCAQVASVSCQLACVWNFPELEKLVLQGRQV